MLGSTAWRTRVLQPRPAHFVNRPHLAGRGSQDLDLDQPKVSIIQATSPAVRRKPDTWPAGSPLACFWDPTGASVGNTAVPSHSRPAGGTPNQDSEGCPSPGALD